MGRAIDIFCSLFNINTTPIIFERKKISINKYVKSLLFSYKKNSAYASQRSIIVNVPTPPVRLKILISLDLLFPQRNIKKTSWLACVTIQTRQNFKKQNKKKTLSANVKYSTKFYGL